MRSASSAIGFFFVIILITLIYKLPANFVYQQLPQSNVIQLNGIVGSIWSGRVDTINTQQVTFNNLNWQLSAWSLLVGDIDVQWALVDDAVNLQGNIKLSGDNIQIHNLEGQIDLLELGGKITEQPVVLGGQVIVDVGYVEIEDKQLIDVSGLVEWKSAMIVSPENVELGEFKAVLSNDSDQLLAMLSDTDGAVELQGDFNLSPTGTYSYAINIGIRDTSVPGLLDGFNQLGKQDYNGRITLQANDRLF